MSSVWKSGVWGLALSFGLGSTSLYAQLGESLRDIRGQAVYEKVLLTPAGLDPASLSVRPIQGALAEAVDAGSGALVASSVTDSRGDFVLSVPAGGTYRVRVSAQLVSDAVRVLNNTEGDALWFVSGELDSEWQPVRLRATDANRAAGAFNILDAIRRANAFVRSLEPDLTLPPLRVFWSPLNTDDPDSITGRYVGGTWFDARAGYAVVLGDRANDSDEYDDDVILHEYAHFLAARFSRDDSIGGPHAPGDVLDPRVSWSEGWADFFPALVSGVPAYRDSMADGLMEYELEANFAGDWTPGYWSERTVHTFLWDLADDAEDAGDMLHLPPETIWQAFRALSGDAFVYLPTFLDQLARLDGVDRSTLEQLARIHSLDYTVQSERGAPAFPKVLDGAVATGELDSWSSRRANLARSAHLYTFFTSGGAVSIGMEITGLGSARNSDANDLDLILMDETGRQLLASASPGNGVPERISTFLPPGNYVVEVRSFKARRLRVPAGFNSGTYRLTISRP